MSLRNAYLEPQRDTIEAGKEKKWTVPDASMILVVSTQGKFIEIQLDGQGSFEAFGGFSYTTDGGETFTRVRIRNNNAEAVTVHFFTGNGNIKNQVLAILSEYRNEIYQPAPNAGDDGATTIGAGASEQIAAAKDGIESVVATWASGTGAVYLRHTNSIVNDNSGVPLQKGVPFPLRFAGDLHLFNAGGDDVVVSLSRFFSSRP